MHMICAGITPTLFWKRQRWDRESLEKQELLHLLLLRDTRQGGNFISWAWQDFPPFLAAAIPPQWQWQWPAPLCKQNKQQGHRQFVILHHFRPALPAHRAEKEKNTTRNPPGAAVCLKHPQMNEMGIPADTWEKRNGLLYIRLLAHFLC